MLNLIIANGISLLYTAITYIPATFCMQSSVKHVYYLGGHGGEATVILLILRYFKLFQRVIRT